MTPLPERIEEILSTFIMQYSQRLKGSNPKNIAAEQQAKDQINALLTEARIEGQIKGMDMVNGCHGCVDNDEWMTEEYESLQKQLNKEK